MSAVYTPRAMRRWVVLLLVFLLPIQSGWAAISAVCADAYEAGASHLGHHVHADAQPAAPADQDPDEPHFECRTCLGVGAGVSLGKTAAFTVDKLPSVRIPFTAPSLPRPPPGVLLRPPPLRVA